jgi:hypothetical protein
VPKRPQSGDNHNGRPPRPRALDKATGVERCWAIVDRRAGVRRTPARPTRAAHTATSGTALAVRLRAPVEAHGRSNGRRALPRGRLAGHSDATHRAAGSSHNACARDPNGRDEVEAARTRGCRRAMAFAVAVRIAAHTHGFDLLHSARTTLGWQGRSPQSSEAAAMMAEAISWTVVIELTSLGSLAPRSVVPAHTGTQARVRIGRCRIRACTAGVRAPLRLQCGEPGRVSISVKRDAAARPRVGDLPV